MGRSDLLNLSAAELQATLGTPKEKQGAPSEYRPRLPGESEANYNLELERFKREVTREIWVYDEVAVHLNHYDRVISVRPLSER
jgi:hypothetical protein